MVILKRLSRFGTLGLTTVYTVGHIFIAMACTYVITGAPLNLAAADAIIEAIDSKIELIVCITEGIPTKDMIIVKEYLSDKDCALVGPNCPGVITPNEAKCGIMPGFVFKQGRIGVVSKSGTLTYEAADQVVKAGMGISTAIGIGGDPIIGTTTKQAVELFMNDPETEWSALKKVFKIENTATFSNENSLPRIIVGK